MLVELELRSSAMPQLSAVRPTPSELLVGMPLRATPKVSQFDVLGAETMRIWNMQWSDTKLANAAGQQEMLPTRSTVVFSFVKVRSGLEASRD